MPALPPPPSGFTLPDQKLAMLSLDQVHAFDRDGYVIVPDLFTPQEIEILLANVTNEGRVTKHQFNMPDAAGLSSKLALWSDVSNDVFGAVTTSPRIVNNVRMLLREDLYHWHSKVMLKEARVGGAWEWHQDYGYWYGDGCLYPRLISCMIALDVANKENGCLKVIPGSHLIGRLNHGPDRLAGSRGPAAEQHAGSRVQQRLGRVGEPFGAGRSVSHQGL